MKTLIYLFVASTMLSQTLLAQQSKQEAPQKPFKVDVQWQPANPLNRLTTTAQWQKAPSYIEYLNVQRPEQLRLGYYHTLANPLAATTGNYLAQTPEELQTFYDLKLEYKYLESKQIRDLLALESGEGILVTASEEEGLGYQAGFRGGDLVLAVGDEPVDTQYDLVIALTKARGGQAGSALVRRSGETQKLTFTLPAVEVKSDSRWIIGVSVEEMSQLLKSHLNVTGAVVTAITKDSPAEKMGLLVDDIITKINETEISNLDDLRAVVNESKGSQLTLDLIRAGNNMNVELTPKKVASKSLLSPQERFTFQYLYPHHQAGDIGADAIYSWSTKAWDVNAQQGVEPKTLESLSKQIEELKTQLQELRETIGK